MASRETKSLLKPFWYASCYRVRDMSTSVNFFVEHFKMCLIHQLVDNNILYSFLISPKHGEHLKKSNHACQDSLPAALLERACLILRAATSQELAYTEKMNNGNEEPHRGFGHIAFNCNSVDESCSRLEAEGVTFRKRPNEGRMKGLAFALDPDGYYIEICGRGASRFREEFNLSQTMIRVKDPKQSIAFYRDILGMVLVREMHMSDFSNYFMASLPDEDDQSQAEPEKQRDFVHSLWNPCLELTHNHGTEKLDTFCYHNGDEPPFVGFSHMSFHVDDLMSLKQRCSNLSVKSYCSAEDQSASCEKIEIQDPDGYNIRIVARKCFSE